MKFTLHTPTGQAYDTYAYTGGKAFDATQPTLVFIHGVLNDHSVWILQTRYLAHHGFNVLAVDLPVMAAAAAKRPAASKRHRSSSRPCWMRLAYNKLA